MKFSSEMLFLWKWRNSAFVYEEISPLREVHCIDFICPKLTIISLLRDNSETKADFFWIYFYWVCFSFSHVAVVENDLTALWLWPLAGRELQCHSIYLYLCRGNELQLHWLICFYYYSFFLFLSPPRSFVCLYLRTW